MFDEVRDVTALLNSNVLLIAGTIIALVVIVLIALIVRKKLFIKLVSFLNKHIDALLFLIGIGKKRQTSKNSTNPLPLPVMRMTKSRTFFIPQKTHGKENLDIAVCMMRRRHL